MFRCLRYFKSKNFTWLYLKEFVNYVIATILLFLAFIIQISTWLGRDRYGQGRNITAGIVGIIDTVAFALSARLQYLQYKFERSTWEHICDYHSIFQSDITSLMIKLLIPTRY